MGIYHESKVNMEVRMGKSWYYMKLCPIRTWYHPYATKCLHEATCPFLTNAVARISESTFLTNAVQNIRKRR